MASRYNVWRFGLLIRFATEKYEVFNGVFRLNSIHSNRLAPSRDIATRFATMDRVKHLLSGGYWWDSSRSCWIQAGAAVQKILLDDPVFQRHLGWVSPKKIVPGAVKLFPAAKSPPLAWNDTTASKHWLTENPPNPESAWRRGQSLTAQSGDKVAVGSWVWGLNAEGRSVIGRITEILSGARTLVTIEQFICGERPHPEFEWPVLRRPNGAEITQGLGNSFIVLSAGSIQFVCSVQHDCRLGKCRPDLSRKEMQEREETSRIVSLIKHADGDHFILNTIALHNFVRLSRVLPRPLIELKPLNENHVAFHKEMAAQARVN
ncbi:hypothetical protein R3P38DRAFT_2591130 [Favolaschia claudopus]|uniref:Uncharacterized protein n=1 Tax=Favolaschia claudopus TaxID=2862362 RepID=A0AAV9YYU6_9AGAR